MRKGNFNLDDGSRNVHAETAQQIQNKALQQQWDSGTIAKIAPQAAKPVTSVRFGKGCEYTSEAKATYTGKEGYGRQNDDRNIYKDKFKGKIQNQTTNVNQMNIL